VKRRKVEREERPLTGLEIHLSSIEKELHRVQKGTDTGETITTLLHLMEHSATSKTAMEAAELVNTLKRTFEGKVPAAIIRNLSKTARNLEGLARE